MTQDPVRDPQTQATLRPVDEQLSRMYSKLSLAQPAPQRTSAHPRAPSQACDPASLVAEELSTADMSPHSSLGDRGVAPSLSAAAAGTSTKTHTHSHDLQKVHGLHRSEVSWGAAPHLTSSLNYTFALTEEQLRADEAQKVFRNLSQIKI